MQNRDRIIDFYKFIGLLAIILAHVSAPGAIAQLRNFDVVLMVLLEGVSYNLSVSKQRIKNEYIAYVYKRFKRLVIPTWLFLLAYFSIVGILGHFGVISIVYSIEDYIDSFLLVSGQPNTHGIGFVWIMRVYFLTSLILPIAKKISEKISKKMYICGIILILSLYTSLLKLPFDSNSILGMMFENVILYMISYGMVAALGLIICNLTKKECAMGAVISLMQFLLQAFIIRSYTQTAKYPPQFYYFSYAFFIIFSLFYLRDKAVIKWLSDKLVIKWIAQNSLWIYFMHIVPIKLYEYKLIKIGWDNFITRYFLVLTIACLLVITKNVMFFCIRSRFKGDRKK